MADEDTFGSMLPAGDLSKGLTSVAHIGPPIVGVQQEKVEEKTEAKAPTKPKEEKQKTSTQPRETKREELQAPPVVEGRLFMVQARVDQPHYDMARRIVGNTPRLSWADFLEMAIELMYKRAVKENDGKELPPVDNIKKGRPFGG